MTTLMATSSSKPNPDVVSPSVLTQLLKASILGGFTMFVWLMFSWMFLPWHQWGHQPFSNPQRVASMIRQEAHQPGVYLLPGVSNHPQDDLKQAASGPFAYMVIRPGARDLNFMRVLLSQFCLCWISALFLSGLVRGFRDTGYWFQVGTITLWAAVAGLACYAPDWLWWEFPISVVWVKTFELMISWFLASLWIVRVMSQTQTIHQDVG